MDDRELLRDYVERQSEAAFAELVARHVNLVYGTARRVVGDDAAAQDVVQAVFIHLARKAWTVRDGRALPGWLYRAAYRTALDAIRGEQRRRQRETEAMKLAEINATDDAIWEKLVPLLDEALQHLNRAEQSAVLSRFFEGKTMRETGVALGTTEAAAQMRVGRALEKMRAHFARGGVTVAAGALALVLSARPSEAAPVGLAARVTGPALAGAEGAGMVSILARILFMSTKTKVVTALMVGILIFAIFTIKLSRSPSVASRAETNPSSDKPRTVALPVVAAVPAKSEMDKSVPDSVNAVSQPSSSALSGDPRAELSNALPDIISIIEAKDFDRLVKDYISPDVIELMKERSGMTDEQIAQTLATDPKWQLKMKLQVEALNSFIGVTPKYNAAGDIATFKLDMSKYIYPGANPSTPIPATTTIFHKVNGKWYMDLVGIK